MESTCIVTNRATHFARRLLALPLAVVSLFVLFPVATMVVQFGRLDSLWDSLVLTSMQRVWWFSTWQALFSTVLTLAVGLPATWALARYRFRGARFIAGLLTVPFLMPAVVVASGIRAVLPDGGVGAILWAHVAFNVAVVLRVVGPRWALLDQVQIETAADLGARPTRIMTAVVWPYIKPAVFNAASLVFIFCFTSFAIVSILGGISRRTVEGEIFIQAIRLGDTGTATALALLQAVVIGAVVGISSRYKRSDVLTLTSTTASPPREYMAIFLCTALPAVIVTSPLVLVLARSLTINGVLTLDGFRWLFDGTTETAGINIASVIRTSLVFAFICVVIAIPLALTISTALSTSTHAHTKTPRWPRAIALLTTAPMVLSSVTLGLGLIVTFDQWPFDWRSQQWLIPMIHAVIALPLATYVLVPAAQAIPNELRLAASSLGASPLRTWIRIDMPLLTPAIRRASGLCAAVSLGEFGATSFLSRSGSTTIPLAISQLINRPGDVLPQSAFALAAITIGLCAVLLSSR